MAKFLDLCSGVGAFRMASEQLNHESAGYAEIDKFPRRSYEAIYDTTGEWTAWDLTQVSNEEWESFKGEVDYITGGFPCFAPGTLITTINGPKVIEDIEKGDIVLTHTLQFKEVVILMTKNKKGIYQLKVQGSPLTLVTEEHPYYVKELIDGVWSEPRWVEVKDLNKEIHLVALVKSNEIYWVPIEKRSYLPEWEGDVYNMEVADDNSYVANSVIVHNCQAFSVAGKGLGFQDTRGTVFFDVARAIKHVSPQHFILENVKNLLSHDKGNTIDVIIRTLNEMGYTVDYTILNSKFYDVPHHRERVFIVGKKDGEIEDWVVEGNNVLAKSKRRIQSYDWAKTFNFNWPTNDVVTKQLIDILEPEEDVPPHLYLSPEKTQTLIESILERDEKLGRTDAQRMLGLLDIKGHESVRRVHDPLGISPTLTTMSGGNREPKILVAGNINPSGKGMGGQVYHAEGGLSPTINAGHEGGKQIIYSPTEKEEATLKVVGNTNPSGRGMNGQVYQAENGLSPTLSTNKGEGIKIALCPILTPDKVTVRQNGRRLKDPGEEMFTLTAQDRHGILMYTMPQKVLVRKHEVNKEALSTLLRKHKEQEKLSIKQIAETLDKPKTLVDHWFRTDKSFAIPEAEVWFELKELLKVETDKFDASITEFIEKDNEYEKSNRVYDARGIAPTLTRTSADEKIFHNYVVRKLTPRECWRLQSFPDWAYDKAAEVNSASQLYKQAGNSLTVNVAHEIIKRLIP